MEAMIPKDMHVEITSVAETPIMFATSSRVTNSVSLRVFSPSIRSNSAISRRSVRSARLSRRILEPFDFRPPPNFSRVSLILRSISSLETSLGAAAGAPRRAPKPGRVLSRRGPPTLAAPVVVRPPPAAGFWRPSVLMRLRLPASPAALGFLANWASQSFDRLVWGHPISDIGWYVFRPG